MLSDVIKTSAESTVREYVNYKGKPDMFSFLRDRFAYLATYPERATYEDKNLLVVAAILLKNCKRHRIKTTAQVAHICECARWFMQVFDTDFDRTNYTLFSNLSESQAVIKILNTDPPIVEDMITVLFKNWNIVKGDTYVYRLLNELLTTIPKV